MLASLLRPAAHAEIRGGKSAAVGAKIEWQMAVGKTNLKNRKLLLANTLYYHLFVQCLRTSGMIGMIKAKLGNPTPDD